MLLEGKVGPTRADYGDKRELRLGYDAELITSDIHGRYYQAALNGNMFIATTLTAGIALIVAATTGNHPTLWNPAGRRTSGPPRVRRLSRAAAMGLTL